MTHEQEIKIRSCFCNGVEYKKGIGISEEYQKLAEIMDGAIKKQIPKKPFIESEHYCCSVCGYTLMWTVLNMYDEINFCSNCGQKIDWSEKL